MITKILNFIKDWPLLFIATNLLAGLAIATYFQDNFTNLLLVSLALSALLGFFKIFQKMAYLLVILVVIFLTANFIVRCQTYPLIEEKTKIQDMTGVIDSVPDKTKNGYSAILIINKKEGKIRTKVFYKEAQLSYGDKIKVSGEIPAPNNEFPTKGYLYSNQIKAVIYSQKIEKIGASGNTNFLIHKLYNLRSQIVNWSTDIFPRKSAGIINAMIFGDTTLLSSDTEEVFLRTGTTHLLVVSGANVLLIAWILKTLLSPLGVNFARSLNICVIVCFIIFTGAEPSIVRAGIIFILITFAELIGRKPHYPTLLAFIACLMSISNPWIILYNITFQLSFAAVIGLTIFSKKIEAFVRIPFLKEILAPTISASALTLPIIVFHFSQLSTVFLIANILAVPLVPFITIFGLVAMVIPFLPTLALIADGIVLILLKILTLLSELEFSFIIFQNKLLPFIITCATVMIIIILLARLPNRSYEKI